MQGSDPCVYYARVERPSSETVYLMRDRTFRWVVPWFRVHSAREDYECDHCGDTIYKGDEYYRKVGVVGDGERARFHVERYHTNTGCSKRRA